LVERVVMCFECHSTRDERGNLMPSTKFLGGPMPMRPPWPANWPETIPRIAGLPGYTDELAMRLLTQGAVKRDGTLLRRPMPAFRRSASRIRSRGTGRSAAVRSRGRCRPASPVATHDEPSQRGGEPGVTGRARDGCTRAEHCSGPGTAGDDRNGAGHHANDTAD